MALDENIKVADSERLPVKDALTVLRYKTIKKNNALGWWSAVVLLEDHGKRQVCFYRWRKRENVWKREKKLAFRSKNDWEAIKEAVEGFLPDLGEAKEK